MGMTPPKEVQDYLAALSRELKPALAVDLGTGSGATARALATGSAHVITIEHDPQFLIPNTNKLLCIYAPLREQSFSVGTNSIRASWYDTRYIDPFLKGRKIGLIFVDGPQRCLGREPAFYALRHYFKKDTLIILDDACTEIAIAKKWKELYPDKLTNPEIIKMPGDDLVKLQYTP